MHKHEKNYENEVKELKRIPSFRYFTNIFCTLWSEMDKNYTIPSAKSQNFRTPSDKIKSEQTLYLYIH